MTLWSGAERASGARGLAHGWLSAIATVVAATFVLAMGGTAAAQASGGSPWWHLSTWMYPSNLAPGGEATVVFQASNVGDAPTGGFPALKETFPSGISIQAVSYYLFAENKGLDDLGGPVCTHTETEARCAPSPEIAQLFEEIGLMPVRPYEDLEMRVRVKDEGANPAGAEMKGEVTGGGAPTAAGSQSLSITGATPTFGVQHMSVVPEEEGGAIDVRAGSHPFQMTSSFTLNQSGDPARPPAMARNVSFAFPPGFVGNASSTPRCSDADFKAVSAAEASSIDSVNLCPSSSVVGVAMVTFDEPIHLPLITAPVPVFNLIPEHGEPARFGFEIAQTPIIISPSIRSGGDYGVTVTTTNISELTSAISATVTLWGVPGDQRHNNARGWSCLADARWYQNTPPPCVGVEETAPSALLTLPAKCGPFSVAFEGTSWPIGGVGGEVASLGRSEYSLTDEYGRQLDLAGCGQQRFEPSIDVAPEVTRASSPTGLDVHLHMPEEVDEAANGLAESTIKDMTVALPPGLSVNPASANGLEGCPEAAVGYLGPEGMLGGHRFTSTLPESWEEGIGFCSTASKIGTVDVSSRLLPPGQHVKGAVYLATQNTNPFGSLLALYVVAEDPTSGVVIKLAGEVSPDPLTGQLVTTIRSMPQLPFEDARLHFFGGERASLATPAHCGRYVTNAAFVPWSAKPGAAPKVSSSSFDITSGPRGTSCAGASLPFSPSLTGGPTNLNAGSFSPLTTTISREDGEQNLQTVELHMPPGLSGLLSNVKLCAEQQANEGTCGQESLIGEATVDAGVGSDPVSVTGGRVYITEKYAGASFGLSIVSPVKAGPFDLERDTSNPNQQPACDCIVVRAKIAVDPHTAELTITTDSSGPHAIPRLIDGIPVEIKKVSVNINRPDFTFNPTNCNPLSMTGTIGGNEGASQAVSEHFQVTNCAALKFAPNFKVSTSAKTSKANGASLVVKVSYPSGSLGTQANIKSVKVSLPKALPSRLTTIQQACPEGVFAANPASCPVGSNIGIAIASTPVLTNPLSGPAYLVSHGGASFPDLVMILQGEGVTLDLLGSVNIKKGITSSTFASVPDAPISSFVLSLPASRHSALAANLPAKAHGNLCGTSLTMPTTITGQNGAQIQQNTKIAVTGCPKARKVKKHKAKHKHRAKRRKK